MFDLQIYLDSAALLPKAIAAIQHFGIVESLYVDVFYNELTVTALHGEPGNLIKVGEVYLDLRRDCPNGLKINLRLLLRHLEIAGDGERLFIKKDLVNANRLVLEATDLEFKLLRDSEIPLEEDYNDRWLFLKERHYE